MKKKYLFIFCLLAISLTSYAQLSIEQCQKQARDNYPLIKQFDLIEQSKSMTLANAAKAYLPQLSVSGIAGYMNGMPEFNLPIPGTETSENSHFKLIGFAQLSQVIWDGGSIGAQRKIAAASADVEKENVEVILHGIKERVNQLYFGILLLDEQLKQLDILNNNLQKNLTRAETAYKNGVAFQSDISAIKVEMLNVEQSRINLSSQRKAYVDMLALMINQKLNEHTTFAMPANETVLPDTTINRPELRLYQQQQQLNHAQNSVVNSRLMPKVGLMGFAAGLTPGINFGTEKFDHILVAGLNLSWNIGGLYTQKNEKSILKINELKIQNNQETFLFNTKLQLHQSNSAIERSQQLMLKDDEIVRLRQSIKDATEKKYENGTCTMTDLVNDINAENSARQNKALHQVEYLMNVYAAKTIAGNN